MKTILNITLILLTSLLWVSCENDDKTIVYGIEGSNLSATSSEVAIGSDDKTSLVLSLIRTDKELLTNESGAQVPNSFATYVLQASTDESFSIMRESPMDAPSKGYTGQELNTLATQLGIEENVKGTIYFRVKTTVAANIDVYYSNVVPVAVTPTAFSAAYLYMPSKDSGFTDFTDKLFSAEENNIYTGFINAAQWYNFRFYTTDNIAAVVYGSDPDDLYKLNDGDNKWDIWFDEGGYFYLTADLNTKTWSKTVVESISITGDFNNWSDSADLLTYDQTTKLWTATVDINYIEWGVKFLINKNWSWCYVDANYDGTLIMAEDPNIIPPEPGIYLITLDLNDPGRMTYKFEKQ